jgi:ATP-dependent helicase HrpB
LLDERDPMRHGTTAPDADILHRVAIVEGRERSSNVDRETVRRVREHARTWRAMLRIAHRATADESECGRALALAFPDRVAQRRSGAEERYVLRNGLGALLPEGSSLTERRTSPSRSWVASVRRAHPARRVARACRAG